MSDNIPHHDIQTEIMKMLPIKSVIKFRSVSTEWKSTIGSSKFITDYNNSSTHLNPNQLLAGDRKRKGNNAYLFDADERFPRIMYPLTPPTSVNLSDTVINCSQGLVGFLNRGDKRVVIWNPSIRKSVVIPVPHALTFPYETVFGIGAYNASDPIIVKINYIDDRDFLNISDIPFHVELFKSSTGDWRSWSNTPRKSLALSERSPVVIDKFIYWYANDMTTMEDNNLILAFDMTTEEFSEIYFPVELTNSPHISLGISKCRESLVVDKMKFEPGKQEIDIWIKMEQGIQNSFTKLYTIKIPDASIGNVLGFMKNGQPIIRLNSGQRQLCFYDPETQSFNDSGIHAYRYKWLVGPYMASLALIDH